jgi:hypothetical protein
MSVRGLDGVVRMVVRNLSRGGWGGCFAGRVTILFAFFTVIQTTVARRRSDFHCTDSD